MPLLVAFLLAVTRAGVLLVPLLPLVTGGRPWGGLLVEPTFFPDVVVRSVAFRLLIEGLVVAWAALACLDARYRPRLRGTLAALLAFTAVIGLSAFLGHDADRAVWSNLERMEGWIGIVHLLGFFVVAAAVMTGERWWNAFFHISFAVAAIVSVTVWLQLLAPDTFPLHQRLPMRSWFRADAWLGNAVYVAIYLNGHVFLAALWAVRSFAAARRRAAIGYVVLGLLYLSATYHTATRAATYLAVPLGVVVIAALVLLTSRHAVRVRRASIAALAIAVVVTGTIALLALLTPDLLAGAPGMKRLLMLGHSLEGRDLVWGVAMKGFFEHPLLGWGPENFKYVFDHHYDPRLWRYDPWYDHPHNVFLGWAVAGGVVGFVSYAVLFVSPLWTLWRRGGTAFSSLDRCVLTGWLVSHAAILFFVFDNLNSHVLFLSIAAWIHVAGHPVPAPERPSRLRWLALPVAAGAIFGVVHLADAVALRPYRASVRLARLAFIPKMVASGADVPFEQLVPEAQMALEASKDTLAEEEGIRGVFDYATTLGRTPQVPKDLQRRLLDMALLIQRRFVKEQEARGTPSAAALLALANELAAQDRAKEALPYAQEALAMAPDRELVLRNLAALQHRAGQEGAAQRTLARAAHVVPGSAKIKAELAAAAIRTGDEATAKKLLRQMYGSIDKRPFRKIQPSIVDAAYASHRAHLLVPIYQRRVAKMNQLLQQRRPISKAWQYGRYRDLALAYAESKQPREAIKVFRQMARRFPKRAPGLRALAALVRDGHRLLRRKADGSGFELALPEPPRARNRAPRQPGTPRAGNR